MGWFVFFAVMTLIIWNAIKQSKARVANAEAEARSRMPDQRARLRRQMMAQARSGATSDTEFTALLQSLPGTVAGELDPAEAAILANEDEQPLPEVRPAPASYEAALLPDDVPPASEVRVKVPAVLHPLQPTSNRFADAGPAAGSPADRASQYATAHGAASAPRPSQTNVPDYAAPAAVMRTTTLPDAVTAALPVSALPTASTTMHAAHAVTANVPDYAPPSPTSVTATLPDNVTAALPVSAAPFAGHIPPPPTPSGPVILGQGFNYKPQLVVSKFGQKTEEK